MAGIFLVKYINKFEAIFELGFLSFSHFTFIKTIRGKCSIKIEIGGTKQNKLVWPKRVFGLTVYMG